MISVLFIYKKLRKERKEKRKHEKTNLKYAIGARYDYWHLADERRGGSGIAE